MKKTNLTTNNALVNAILSNRGFSNRKIDANQFSAEQVSDWHKVLNNLHNECYRVAAICYNSEESADYSPIYSAIGAVYSIIGEVNGGKLRSDENTATVLISKATRESTKYSGELQYVMSKKRNASKRLAELEETNGTCEQTIENLRAEIAGYESEIEALSGEYGNKYKEFSKCSQSTFYKAVEDFLADMLEERLAMTEEEVQAEAEKKRQERRAKTAAKNKAKKEAKEAEQRALTAC